MNLNRDSLIKALLAIISAITAMGTLYLYFTHQLSDRDWENTVILLTTFLATLTTVAILHVAFRTNKEADQSRHAYWGLFLAWASYLIGWLVFSFSHFTKIPLGPLGILPDVFWLIGTILLIDDLLQHGYRLGKHVALDKGQTFILFTGIGIFLLILIWVAFWEIIVAGFDPIASYGPFQKALDLFYFTTDGLILYASGIILLRLIRIEGWRDDLGWMFLIVGMVFMILGDTLVAHFGFYGTSSVILATLESWNLYLPTGLMKVLSYACWIIGATLFPIFQLPAGQEGLSVVDHRIPTETVEIKQKKMETVGVQALVLENEENLTHVKEEEKSNPEGI